MSRRHAAEHGGGGFRRVSRKEARSVYLDCVFRPIEAPVERDHVIGKRCRRVSTTVTSFVAILSLLTSWPLHGRAVSATPPSSRRRPARSRPANLPGRNGSPPPFSRSALATRGRG